MRDQETRGGIDCQVFAGVECSAKNEVRSSVLGVGDVNGDLSGRRGRILGMDVEHGNKEVIRAAVPESEMLRYATELRSLSSGRGTYSAKFSHYEEVPEGVFKDLVAEYEKSRNR